MIVQISRVRNELLLIKELLPVWSTFADGFVFYLDTTTDGTADYLNSVKEQYNILEILSKNEDPTSLKMETEERQLLFNTARKYSNKIICLDADEYLDGIMTKAELSSLLDNNADTVFHLRWVQYTSANTIRIDGPWKSNIKDRIGSYSGDCLFVPTQMHSTHLPIPQYQSVINSDELFIAHLQWLDKNHVGIKQYFWKVEDYVNSKVYSASVAGTDAYDQSVNNFQWEEEYFDYSLKIRDDVFELQSNIDNYRLDYIKEQTLKHNIPNLGDWGLNIHNSIPMYFCTAADEKHYPLLINLIGSLHHHNFYDIVEIRVYDLGLSAYQKEELANIKKVSICQIEETNPQMLEYIQTSETKLSKGAFSWKPVVIKDSLDHQPYTLYLDAGTNVLKPLNNIFKHICENGYLLFDCGHSIKWMTTQYVIKSQNLDSVEYGWILNDDVLGIDAGFQGLSRQVYDNYVIPIYESTRDINNYLDDKTCPDGYGCARQDQTLFSIQARKLNLEIHLHDRIDQECCLLVNGEKQSFHLTHLLEHINDQTTIFRSRWNLSYEWYKTYAAALRRNYKISVITAIGSLARYSRFIDNYIENIKQMVDFTTTQFVIVYTEWSSKFDTLKEYPNILFVKDNEQSGVYNAWNIGIMNASCEYITNWNVDDIRYSVNNIIKSDLLKKDLQVDLAYSYYIGVSEDELGEVDLDLKKPITYPDNFHEQVLSMCMAGPDPMWRKSAHIFAGLFNKSYSIVGDWEMWIRMATHGLKFKLIPYVLGVYVDHSDTISHSNAQELENQKKQLMQQYRKW